MRISTKGRYGLRVLLDIALHEDAGPVILRDIARRQDISEKYLWQVVNPLKAAGIVRAARGAKGGYGLAKAPAEITVLDAVTVLEGPVCVAGCEDEGDACGRAGKCATQHVWTIIEDNIKATMRGITLRDLVDRQRDIDADSGLSYVI